MAIIGGILILLSFLVGIAAWVGLFAPKVFTNRKTGKEYNRLVLFFGNSFAATVLLVIGAAMLPHDAPAESDTMHTAASSQPTEAATAETTPPATTATPQSTDTPETAEPEHEAKAEFGFTFEQYKKWVNDDLKLAKSDYRIPANVKPDNKKGNINNVATVHFHENFGLIATVTPSTNKVNGLTLMLAAKNNDETLSTIVAAALILASADGENGNKSVGVKIIELMNSSLQEFTDGKMQKSVDKSIVLNNIKYTVQLHQGMPMMMFAEPMQ